MKNRLTQSKINIAYGLMSKIVIMLLEFVARYFFVKYLGSELLGVNGVFTNVIQCLSLAELGMNNVVMFSYYKPLAENDERKLAALNTFYRKIYNGIAAAVAIIGLLLVPLLKYIIKTDFEIPDLVLIYLLFLTDTVVSYFCIYKVTILTADQNAYVATKYDIIINVIRTIFQIASLIVFKNFILYLSIKIVFSVLGNILKARKVDRKYCFTQRHEILAIDDKKEIIETIKSGFIYKLSAILLNSTDNVLISTMVGTIWVGLLSNYVTLCTAVASFVTIVYNNITASVGNLVTTENKKKRFEIFNIMSVASNWIAFVCFSCTLVLCDDFMTLWLGQEYIMDFSIVLPKVMMLYISCVMQPIFSFREALGLYKKTKYVMLLSAIINVVLSVVMGNIIDTSGILIASLIAVVFTYFWYEPLILHHDCFGTSVKPYYIRVLFNVMVCGLVTVIFKNLLDRWMVLGWLGLVIKGIFIFVATNIICVVMYYRTDEFKYILSKVIRRSGR